MPLETADQNPVLFGCAGMGGYAGAICDLLLDESAKPRPPVRLKAVCDLRPGDHPRLIERLAKANVMVHGSYAEMLTEKLDAVWLPLPIHLHRPTTELALGHGMAVMCEKPVAGSVDDLDAMAIAQTRAALPVAIGYQDIYDPATRELKQRLLDGAIGDMKQIVLRGTWPRDERYFNRNDWAGSLRQGDTWVLDSPVNNAMAHFLNLAMFLAGPTLHASAEPLAIDAELYRANAIENYDTCALRATLQEGVVLLVLMTHACQTNFGPVIEMQGSEGTAVYTASKDCVITRGNSRQTVVTSRNVRSAMVDRFARYVRGNLGDDLVATLATSRPPLVVVNGASEAVAVRDIPAQCAGSTSTPEGGQLRFIKGIEQAFEYCGTKFLLPGETGMFPWAAPHGSRDLHGYMHFVGPHA